MADESRVAYERAIDLFGHGELEEAAAALRAIIEKDPGFYDAYESLGMIYSRQGKFDEAIAWTEKLAALRPEEAMPHTNLSIFYMKKGMKEKAEEEKAKATVIHFQNAAKTRRK
jgi:Flp pilus assembly protein TadD